jgi:hypothetical protein
MSSGRLRAGSAARARGRSYRRGRTARQLEVARALARLSPRERLREGVGEDEERQKEDPDARDLERCIGGSRADHDEQREHDERHERQRAAERDSPREEVKAPRPERALTQLRGQAGESRLTRCGVVAVVLVLQSTAFGTAREGGAQVTHRERGVGFIGETGVVRRGCGRFGRACAVSCAARLRPTPPKRRSAPAIGPSLARCPRAALSRRPATRRVISSNSIKRPGSTCSISTSR